MAEPLFLFRVVGNEPLPLVAGWNNKVARLKIVYHGSYNEAYSVTVCPFFGDTWFGIM